MFTTVVFVVYLSANVYCLYQVYNIMEDHEEFPGMQWY